MVHRFHVNNVNLTVPLRSHWNQEIRYCSENMRFFLAIRVHVSVIVCILSDYSQIFKMIQRGLVPLVSYLTIYKSLKISFSKREIMPHDLYLFMDNKFSSNNYHSISISDILIKLLIVLFSIHQFQSQKMVMLAPDKKGLKLLTCHKIFCFLGGGQRIS